MKHIIHYLGVLLAVALVGATFTACADDDSKGSADVGLGIKTIFPLKVVTNQPMTINGSGFDGVTEVEFPGGLKVTNFEIIGHDMITLNAPAGIPAEGGKVIVRTASEEAESRLSLTVGHTNVTGFSKQPGETAAGSELISVYGTDLEFINSVELLDADGLPQLIDHKDFYRKGTSSLIFRVPPKNIFKGTFVGILHTYDGQSISMPELAYEPSSSGGHSEIVKTSIWKNDGSLGEINWSSDYRFAPASNSTGEECYTVPQDVWDKMKDETFYVTIKGESPQIRVTSGWWSTTWKVDDIFPGNELLTDNGDGTFTLAVTLAGDPLYDVIDTEHLLFTGGGYSVDEIYFAEEIWVDGGGEDQEVQEFIWQNDGSLGEINWSSDYRFAPASNSTGEECYTVPQDVWDRMKAETFYVTIKGDSPQIRVTSGWWSTTWKVDDIFPGNELLTDNGDGTFTLKVDLAGDPLFDVIDTEHLLFTGSGYTVGDIYFIEIIPGGGGSKAPTVIWESDGSKGAVSWSSDYRFSNEESKTGEEIYAIPMDIWNNVIKSGTFYLDLESTDPQVRVTTGWWSTTWTGNDFQPGTSDLLTDNGDGTWTLKINFDGDAILDALDVEHLLFTGDRFTPLRLYYYE